MDPSDDGESDVHSTHKCEISATSLTHLKCSSADGLNRYNNLTWTVGLARISRSFQCLGQQGHDERIPDPKSTNQPLHYYVCCSQELRVRGDISIRRPTSTRGGVVAMLPYRDSEERTSQKAIVNVTSLWKCRAW